MSSANGKREAAAMQAELRKRADPGRIPAVTRYFRTGPGEYGEEDAFLGATMPQIRALARAHRDAPFEALAALLESPVHEDRMLALVVLVERARRARTEAEHASLARFYLEHVDRVHPWDLVDTSAPQVLGPYFATRSRARLHAFARSPSVWRRRIAILTTLHFIRGGEFDETLRLARILLDDDHDLIHKAVGWMLREVGERDRPALDRFLDRHASTMPRTMLRYAIEKMPPRRQNALLSKRVEVEDPASSWGVRPDAKAVRAYIARLPPPVRAIAAALDSLVREELPGARTGIKWSVPFYYRKGPIAYISAARAHVTFGLVQGLSIADRTGRLRGTGRSPIRKATFRIGEEIPRAAVRAWLREARSLDRSWGRPTT